VSAKSLTRSRVAASVCPQADYGNRQDRGDNSNSDPCAFASATTAVGVGIVLRSRAGPGRRFKRVPAADLRVKKYVWLAEARALISLFAKMRLKSIFAFGANGSFSAANESGAAVVAISALATSVLVTVVSGASAFFGSVDLTGAANT
jgi:hypothetical protein